MFLKRQGPHTQVVKLALGQRKDMPSSVTGEEKESKMHVLTGYFA